MTVRLARIGGAEVRLLDQDAALRIIASRLDEPQAPPLGVVSVNLDHVSHLRRDPDFAGALRSPAVDWLPLMDGAPIVARARALTGTSWPRLAGSDLIGPILAAAGGRRLGVLGGTAEVQGLLRERLRSTHPGIELAGTWAPTRAELADGTTAARIADEIRAAGIEVLLVSLGKPRQERWIAENAERAGARVLLAFGAVVDFLAGRVTRAPAPVAALGMEWAWRLALEPRRLARRYLVEGPPAYLTVRRSARMLPPAPNAGSLPPLPRPAQGRFVTGDGTAEATVIVVTYNSADDIDALLTSLRAETGEAALRVVVADNSSTDDTVGKVAAHPDVTLVRTGGNLGYSAGINAAHRHAPAAEHRLILNPDLTVEPGAIRRLLDRLRTEHVGVVAPRILAGDGTRSPSIRREPSILRALGDAAFGAHWRRRPGWLSDMDWHEEDYRSAHTIDWASGAALLVRAEVAAALHWDERYFLYSEETDFQRRVRDAGWDVWFEPSATVRHRQGGSGTSAALVALSEVNRIRYARKHHRYIYSAAYRGAVIAFNAARAHRVDARQALATVLRGAAWSGLPRGRRDPWPVDPHHLEGSIVIPAHDEEAVIGGTLRALGEVVRAPRVEVLVVANGCSDATADRARSVPGVTVVERGQPGKPGALNAGDAAATRWPRIYLDADIRMSPSTVAQLLSALRRPADGHGPVVEAARPSSRYDTARAGALVRAYYRARDRMPALGRALWGAGVYALSEEGHARFGRFPELIADDLYVDRAIPADRVVVLDTDPVVIRTPRTARSLVRTLRRVARGNTEQGGAVGSSRTARELLHTVRGPASAFDAAVYASFVVIARLSANRRAARNRVHRWERDDTSRTGSAG